MENAAKKKTDGTLKTLHTPVHTRTLAVCARPAAAGSTHHLNLRRGLCLQDSALDIVNLSDMQ